MRTIAVLTFVLMLSVTGTARAGVIYAYTSPLTADADFKFFATDFLDTTTTVTAASLFDVVQPAVGTLDSVIMTNPFEPLAFPAFNGPSITQVYTGCVICIGSSTTNNWPGPFDALQTYTYLFGATLTLSFAAAPPPGVLPVQGRVAPEPASSVLLVAGLGVWYTRRRLSHPQITRRIL